MKYVFRTSGGALILFSCGTSSPFGMSSGCGSFGGGGGGGEPISSPSSLGAGAFDGVDFGTASVFALPIGGDSNVGTTCLVPCLCSLSPPVSTGGSRPLLLDGFGSSRTSSVASGTSTCLLRSSSRA